MAFLDWIDRSNAYELTAFTPLLCESVHVGWVHRGLIPDLSRETDIFQISNSVISLHPALETPQARTEALGDLTDRWFASGILPGWRGEHYRAATALDAPMLFSIERAAAPMLGLRCWGIHVNGYVRKAGGLYMWVAHRATDRPVAPGKCDHIIAGGMPADMTPQANLLKEAHEEAGLGPDIASQAKPTGYISYCFADPKGRLRPDVLLTYDLELPEDLQPLNTDGEVARFELWPIAQVVESVRETDMFKTNCNLVIIDFLIRQGILAPGETPHYEALVGGLRQPFPAVRALT